MSRMRVHFIAVGGAVMHNLAIALHKKGYEVTGSDDEIFEPSRSRLRKYGLLPETEGWNSDNITTEIDTVILGMHARDDNPELKKARELGLTIKSFPEYLYEQTKNKKRIVVAGSHGKTTTTAMILHIFKYLGIKTDYMVGSQIDGFETMVELSEESRFAVLEGDEYLTSALDRRPKFHLYMPDIAILNGISWDHMNVFPTFANYLEQFRIFADRITKGGTLIYYKGDDEVRKIAATARGDIKKIPYGVHPYFRNEKGFFASTDKKPVQLEIFGEHNMQNLSAAKEALLAAGISETDFYSAIGSFRGTSKRLQKAGETPNGIVYLDFAHSPSKVKATIEAVASNYPGRDIVACLELHTYSSLSSDFLPLYKDTMSLATKGYVCFSRHAVELKRLKTLTTEQIKQEFGGDNIEVYDDPGVMFSEIKKLSYNSPVFLLMSSGDFNGFDFQTLI